MKNTSLKHILAAMALAAATQASAQSLPETFNYQAMINADDGSPIANKSITVEVSILQGKDCNNGGACPTVWQELHTPSTNDFGLFNIEIGSADAINTMGGSARKYSDIDWLNVSNGEYFLKVRVDFGEASYLNGMTDMGITKFSAVPYTLVALKCDKAAKADALTTDANGNSSMSLTQMKDVSVKTPTKNQILVYDGSSWKNTDPTAAQGLTNLNIQNPSNGQHLVYNNGNWENKSQSSSTSIVDLSDTDIKALNPNDVLVYNQSKEKWYNQPLTMSIIQGMGNPSDRDVIQFVDGSWKPMPISSGGSSGASSIRDLTDVAIIDPTPNQVLKYINEEWVNSDNDNIWEKNSTGSYYTIRQLGIGSENSVIKNDATDNKDLVKIGSGEGTTHFTGKALTLGYQNYRAEGVGSLALGGVGNSGSNDFFVRGAACIGGYGSTIGKDAKNTIVMGSSSANQMTTIIIGDDCSTQYSSALFGLGLYGVGTNGLVCGKYNTSSSKQLFAVGNGASKTERNTAFAIDVDGNVYVGGTITHSSDSRLKTNVSTLGQALESVMKLRGVTFNWDKSVAANANASDALQYGFIAQEVEKVFPALVSTNENGYKSVNYTGVIPVLTEAIKDQQAEIEDLKKENAELKSTLEALLKRVEALEKR